MNVRVKRAQPHSNTHLTSPHLYHLAAAAVAAAVLLDCSQARAGPFLLFLLRITIRCQLIGLW